MTDGYQSPGDNGQRLRPQATSEHPACASTMGRPVSCTKRSNSSSVPRTAGPVSVREVIARRSDARSQADAVPPMAPVE
jgi:hypothetical protein